MTDRLNKLHKWGEVNFNNKTKEYNVVLTAPAVVAAMAEAQALKTTATTTVTPASSASPAVVKVPAAKVPA